MHFSTLLLVVTLSSAAFSFAAPVSPSNRASLAGAATSGVLSRTQGAENVNTAPKAIARQDLADIIVYVDDDINDILNDPYVSVLDDNIIDLANLVFNPTS